jgi:hypothetical protein
MTNKRKIILSIVSILVLAAFVAVGFHTSTPETAPTIKELEAGPWPSQEVQKIDTNEKTDNYTITVAYPKVNSDSITMQFRSFVDDQIAEFKDDTSWVNEVGSASDGALTLDITYRSSNTPTVQNYIFSVSSYTGGAHGMQVRKTFSFDKAGKLLNISNLFSNGSSGLQTLSALTKKELMKRQGADAKWIDDGAGPTEENYSSFIVTETGVTVLFDQYQVAPYSDGSIDVAIPVSSFAKIANPEIFPKTR